MRFPKAIREILKDQGIKEAQGLQAQCIPAA